MYNSPHCVASLYYALCFTQGTVMLVNFVFTDPENVTIGPVMVQFCSL